MATTSEQPDNTEPQAEVQQADGLPRNPDGTFAPRTPDPEPILGKFKSTEDLIAAYQNLERQQGEKGNELGELRRTVEELQASLEQYQQPQQRPITDQAVVDWFDTLVDQNPAQAAEWARQNGQQHLYDRAMETWYDLNPRQATGYEMSLREQMIRAQLQHELQPTLAPAQEFAAAQAFNRVWNTVAGQYPEITRHGDDIVQAAQEDPEILNLLMSGNDRLATMALENLVVRAQRKLQAGQAETMAQATAQVAAEQRQEAVAARQQATVATASSTVTTDGKGAVDRFKDNILGAVSDLTL